MMKGKFDLAIAVALVPVLGTGLVLMNQLGRYSYYGIPPELLELDAYKVLVSSLSMLFIGSALFYVGSTLYDAAGPRAWHRIIFHILFAAALTVPFWYRDYADPWQSVPFVLFTAGVMFGVERWLRHKVESPRDQFSGWSLVAFFSSLLVLAATCAHGYLSEKDRTTHTFVASSNEAVVGRVGDLLILKTYDPVNNVFVHERTRLVNVETSIILEVRSVLPR
jgi:hypothetical protein